MPHLTSSSSWQLRAAFKSGTLRLTASSSEQAQYLAIVSLTALGLILFSFALETLKLAEFNMSLAMNIFELIAATCMYVLSRSRYYRVGIYVGLLAAVLLGIIDVLTFRLALSILMFFIPILLATMLMSGRAIFIITIGMVVIGTILLEQIPSHTDRDYLYIFLLFFTGLLFSLQTGLKARSQRAVQTAIVRYQALFEQSNDAVFILDLKGKHLEVNQRAADMLGYSRDELMCLSWEDVQILEQPLPSGRAVKGLPVGDTPSASQRRFRRKDGAQLVVESNAALVHDKQGHPLHIQCIVRDITKRKQTEAALRNSEEQLRTIVDYSPVMIALVHPAGRFEFTNQYWLNHLGWGMEELNAHKDPMSLFYPDPKERQMALDYIEDGSAGWRDFQTHSKHHGVIDTSWANVRLSDGRIISIGQDITNRKVMEAALEEKYLELDRFFSVALDLLCIADMQGRFVKVNKAWEEILGYSVHDLETRRFLEFVHPDDRAATEMAMEQLAEEQPVINFVNRYRSQDGNYHFIEWRSVPYNNLIYAAARDITERKQMEEALRQNEAKYRLLAENTSDGMLQIDAQDWRVIYASPSVDREYGRDIGETAGMDIVAFADTIHPEDRDATIATLYSAIADHQETVTYRYRALHTQGHYLWREDHTKFIYAPDGPHQCTYVISRDISERKQALEQAFELAVEKERTKLLTQFVREAAHEFRTPLSVISSSTYLMSRFDDAERRLVKAAQVNTEIARISQLVDKLLLIVQLEAQSGLALNAVSLYDVIMTVCSNARTKHGEHPQLQLELQARLPAIVGDVNYVQTALYELVENAYHFTPTTGIVTVSTGAEDDQAWVEIHDTGVGIPAADLTHIFKTFWRNDTAHTTAGFGLGLPIAKRAIEACGGHITVQSEVGKGSCFRIVFSIR